MTTNLIVPDLEKKLVDMLTRDYPAPHCGNPGEIGGSKPREECDGGKRIAEVTHRYSMMFPGMKGEIIKEWTDPNDNKWYRLDFGENQTGQRLRSNIPANSARVIEEDPEKELSYVLEEIDAITDIGQKRFDEAKDETIKMLHPAGIDWLERDELDRLQALLMKLPALEHEIMGSPQERVRIKRQLRKLGIEFDPKAPLSDLAEALGATQRFIFRDYPGDGHLITREDLLSILRGDLLLKGELRRVVSLENGPFLITADYPDPHCGLEGTHGGSRSREECATNTEGLDIRPGKFAAEGKWAVFEEDKMATNYHDTQEEAAEEYHRSKKMKKTGQAAADKRKELISIMIDAGSFTEEQLMEFTGGHKEKTHKYAWADIQDLGLRWTDAKNVLEKIKPIGLSEGGYRIYDMERVIQEALDFMGVVERAVVERKGLLASVRRSLENLVEKVLSVARVGEGPGYHDPHVGLPGVHGGSRPRGEGEAAPIYTEPGQQQANVLESLPEDLKKVIKAGKFDEETTRRILESSEKSIEQASEQETRTSPMIQRLAQQTGAQIEGFDYRIKGRDSLARKIATDMVEKNLSLEEATSDVYDAVRYTMVFDNEEFADRVGGVQDSLQEQGWSQYDLAWKNYFPAGDNYDGYNTVMENPDTGERFELQFHTPETWQHKMDTHGLYEELRVLPRDSTRRLEVWNQMVEGAAAITRPDGWDRLRGQQVIRQ